MAVSQPAKFVLVDDDPQILKLMGELLEMRGHEVVLFHAGTTAVIDIPDENPDCVITDLMMVGLNGLDLARELREVPKLSRIKIVMVTSQSDSETRSQAEEVGVDAFIAKPIDPAAFANQIEVFLR